jgi:hypothetical protein
MLTVAASSALALTASTFTLMAMMPYAASAKTTNPSFVMTDNYGEVWTLRPAGGTQGTQNYVGTVDASSYGCGTYTATATKTNDRVAGTWDWTFTATSSAPPAGCVDFVFTGTGIGSLSGTWVNAGGRTGYWTSGVTQGAGTPPGA